MLEFGREAIKTYDIKTNFSKTNKDVFIKQLLELLIDCSHRSVNLQFLYFMLNIYENHLLELEQLTFCKKIFKIFSENVNDPDILQEFTFQL